MENECLIQNTQTRYSQIEGKLCRIFSQKAVADYIVSITNIAANTARELDSSKHTDIRAGIDKYTGITSILKDPKQPSQYLKKRIPLIQSIGSCVSALFDEGVFTDRYNIAPAFPTTTVLIDCYLDYKISRSKSVNYIDLVKDYMSKNPNAKLIDKERVVSLFIGEFLRPVSLITDYYTRPHVGDLYSDIIGNWGMAIQRLTMYQEPLHVEPGLVQPGLPY